MYLEFKSSVYIYLKTILFLLPAVGSISNFDISKVFLSIVTHLSKLRILIPITYDVKST